MKRFKVLWMSALAVCALTLAALPVSSASAKAPVLQLNEGETKAAEDASAEIEVEVEACHAHVQGHLTGNDAKTVKVATTGTSFRCPRETAASGAITEASMTSKGALTLKGSIIYSEQKEEVGPKGEAGICAYTFKKFKGTFAIPGPVTSEYTGTGTLVSHSPKGCEKKLSTTVTVTVRYPFMARTEIFEAALVS